jgi:hypothetical protein
MPGLIVDSLAIQGLVSHRVPLAAALTILAATVLAVESLVFVGVHVKYREVAPMTLSGVLGLLMAFIAYGRIFLQPIFCPTGRLTKGRFRDKEATVNEGSSVPNVHRTNAT